MILISLSLVLAARPRFLERFFGGLDQMFQTHKRISMLAFILLIVHFFSIPKTDELINGKPLGMLAFLGMVILVLITVAPRVPLISRFLSLNYTKWRVAHKLLGVFYILGLVHYFLVGTISKQTIPGGYMLLWSVIGILAFVYRQFFSRMFEPYREYRVETVNRLNGTCMEYELAPTGKAIDFKAGQFAYLYFKGPHGMREPHPFTISSAPDDDRLRFTIKACGDWTRDIADTVEPGTLAAVHGAFGMFDHRSGGNEQIWIAGGIGVTPFLSWVRDLSGDATTPDVDFFYSVRGAEDALFQEEFEQFSTTRADFRLHMRYSVRDGNLTLDEIVEAAAGDLKSKHIYMCGPIGMMEGFAAGFKELGVSADQIHYEEFNFR